MLGLISGKKLGPASLALAALGAVACDTPEAATPRQVEAPTTLPESPVSVSGVEVASSDARRRGRIVGGEALARPVRWPSPDHVDRALLARLEVETQSGLAAAPAPVLLPTRSDWAERGQLHTGPKWWAFESHASDMHLNISASAQARLYEGVRGAEGPERVRGQAAFVTRNEGIWSISWLEHGVAYAIELECEATQPACEDERELRALAESLRFVGGAGASASETRGGPR